MPIYGQGDTYEEEEVDEKLDTEQKKSVGSINPKIIALGVSGVAMVVVIVSVLVWSGMQKSKAEQQAQENAVFQEIVEQEQLRQENPELFVQEVTLSYSQSEIEALRLWGYTADEIEISSRDGITAKTLVDQARQDREEAQRQALEVVMDSASPEYKELLDKTWLGGDPVDLESVDPNVIYNNTSKTMIVDYEKCGAQGTQLFIKLYLDDGTAAFMTVTPNRWKELNDSGNIVVEVTWREAGDIKIVVDVHEVRVDGG